MGCSSSKQAVLGESAVAGGAAEYAECYEEGRELGQGEFGVVKLVTNKQTGQELAAKVLRKGFVFKDNTLYNPQPPEEIRRECEILRTLDGKRHVMKLEALFEESKAIYVVTELLSGGEMLDYVAEAYPEGLRTEDASRMSYQLLDAIDHCDSNGIIHRDLKPENIMFKTTEAGSDLKLIDFGCAASDDVTVGAADRGYHATFAGTPFYIAPEVFQKKYNSKADVFSVGVIMYVLVAGYPADVLQKAFNLLQKSKRDLRTLPNMPSNMPDSYFDLLEKLLTYRPTKRPKASELLRDDEFVAFHGELGKKGGGRSKRMSRTSSVVFSETANRHRLLQNYRKFERSVTTVLATVPSNEELQELVKKLRALSAESKRPSGIEEEEEEEEGEEVELDGGEEKKEQAVVESSEKRAGADKLGVVSVGRLKTLLDEMNLKEASETLSKLPGSSEYDAFAYDVDALEDFAKRRNASAEYAAKQQNGNGAAAAAPAANGDAAAAKSTPAAPARGMQGAKGGGFSMRNFNLGGGGGGGGSSLRRMSPRPQRGGGMGRKSMSVFIRT